MRNANRLVVAAFMTWVLSGCHQYYGPKHYVEPELEDPHGRLIAVGTNEPGCEHSKLGFAHVNGDYTARYDFLLPDEIRVSPGQLAIKVTCKGSQTERWTSGFGKDMGLGCIDFTTYRSFDIDVREGQEVSISCKGGDVQILGDEQHK